MIRTFEHFPPNKTCPLCGTNRDEECFLAAIDSTQEGNICDGKPIHTGCLELRWNEDAVMLYQVSGMGAKSRHGLTFLEGEWRDE
jgi:hypothetical protein